eukprot:TRINITY_DN11759_c0_g1_i1.p1 TRINITY_DN11759_c0_g1~~TRINITY_DN11759_c0_g1_i1.p1  ORF type:complete len:301 (-),score=50.33 TRINITY_DN11759_c0_g1_i1:289-1191(-)
MMEKEYRGGVSHLKTEPKAEGGKVTTRSGRAQVAPPGWHESSRRKKTTKTAEPDGWGGVAWCKPEEEAAPAEDAPEPSVEPEPVVVQAEELPADGMVWEDQEDTGLGWLGPENIDQAAASWGGEQPLKQGDAVVACVTTDFAMQNVLLQMGIKVLSVDGMVIKRARCYILKCEACFKTTTELLREFCDSCGNHTLYKVSVQSTSQGVSYYELRGRTKKNNTRGTRFSIPLPKGGRKNTDVVLREDQLRPPKPPKAVDWCDPDAGWELQGKKHAAGPKAYGMGRRNPNERKGKMKGSRGKR